MTTPPRVLLAGLATLDVVQLVDRLPRPNEKVGALDFLVAAGGPAANAAVASARCGSAAILVTALPRHPLADQVVADLVAHGVEVHVAEADGDGPPPTAAIMVTRSSGDRAVVSPTGSAMAERPTPDGLDADTLLAAVDAVLIDGYHRHLSLPLARAARMRGVPVILDAGSWKAYSDEVLAVVDVAVVSDDFAPPGTEGGSDAVIDALLSRGVRCVIITRGSDAVLYRTPVSAGEVEIATVPVADTLGAGDFFHGAFAHRVAELGLDDERIPDDIAWASAVAGASLGAFGTRSWLERPLPHER
ncbi:PfkB family carbohydrate kinase [Demequina capsici]|uniref:PfkB family carbohydrate kinase n=1 Tax=Demequina capsici TaxID=3075620 RepID=A0AA96F8T4_9MICO|nr:PfkB family carbohydrate kinase [Demequina sp. OYTSA14]WNM25369.1 PfkB family carbohydrate kinase [Demequina sp. OYTSA14]